MAMVLLLTDAQIEHDRPGTIAVHLDASTSTCRSGAQRTARPEGDWTTSGPIRTELRSPSAGVLKALRRHGPWGDCVPIRLDRPASPSVFDHLHSSENYLKPGQLPVDDRIESPWQGYAMTALAAPLRLRQPETTTAPVLLSIVIPTHDDAARIVPSVRQMVEYVSLQPYRCELILVDDHSRDETVDAVIGLWEELSGRTDGVELRVLRTDRSRGQGYGVRQGMLASRGEWILLAEPDLSYCISQLDRLFAAAQESGAEITVGSGNGEPDADRQSLPRRVIGAVFARVARILSGSKRADTPSGFKLYRRSAGRTVAALQRTSRSAFVVEHLMLADRLGYQVAQVGVRPSSRDERRIKASGPALRTMFDLVRMRWAHRAVDARHQPFEYADPPSLVRIGDHLYRTCLRR